jgi:flavin reductase (DIM6/NTAB) family NADH-FMN oxidoreductase RutF
MVSVNATGDLRGGFLDAMRRLASTVTIVSTTSDDGPSGMTATAVTSLSADPPAILVCVNRTASIHAKLQLGRRFCISLLGVDHRDLPSVFGGGIDPEKRFDYGTWTISRHGVPFLDDAQSNIFCTVDGLFDYATHTIVIGKVDAVRMPGDDINPLIFGDGRFLTG